MPEEGLTGVPGVDPPQDERSNRRSFTDEDKLAIVMETEQPGVSAAEVCCRHGIVTSMVFRWRVQFGFAQKKRAKLAPVAVTEDGLATSSTVVLRDLLQPSDGMTAVDLPDGACDGASGSLLLGRIGDPSARWLRRISCGSRSLGVPET